MRTAIHAAFRPDVEIAADGKTSVLKVSKIDHGLENLIYPGLTLGDPELVLLQRCCAFVPEPQNGGQQDLDNADMVDWHKFVFLLLAKPKPMAKTGMMDLAAAERTARLKKGDATPCIAMKQNLASVTELWEEYTKGIGSAPPLRDLQLAYGIKWRIYNTGKAHFE